MVDQQSLTPFSTTEVKAGSVLPVNWTWTNKFKGKPRSQEENLESKGESFPCLFSSKPRLVSCGERSPRGWGHISVPESDFAQGKVRLNHQLKSCHWRGNREIKSCPKCSTPATLSREKWFTVSTDTCERQLRLLHDLHLQGRLLLAHLW